MKHIKNWRWYYVLKALYYFGWILLIYAVISLALSFTLPNQPMQGSCGEGWIAKDETAPFEYNGGQDVCSVFVKAGSQQQGEACYGLTILQPRDDCYVARGLGTGAVTVSRHNEGCKEISHVEFYPCEATDTPQPTLTNTPTETSPAPTETNTPTQTATSTGTNTPTEPVRSPTPTTPWKFHTPTPRGSATPTETPGPSETPEGTRTPTQYVSPTPTGTITPGSPSETPPSKTETPAVRLPDTGMIELAGEGAYGLFFGAIMLLVVLVLIFRAWIRSRS